MMMLPMSKNRNPKYYHTTTHKHRRKGMAMMSCARLAASGGTEKEAGLDSGAQCPYDDDDVSYISKECVDANFHQSAIDGE